MILISQADPLNHRTNGIVSFALRHLLSYEPRRITRTIRACTLISYISNSKAGDFVSFVEVQGLFQYHCSDICSSLGCLLKFTKPLLWIPSQEFLLHQRLIKRSKETKQ